MLMNNNNKMIMHFSDPFLNNIASATQEIPMTYTMDVVKTVIPKITTVRVKNTCIRANWNNIAKS